MKVEELKKMTPAQREALRKALEEADAETKHENEEKARQDIQAVLTKYSTTFEALYPKLFSAKKAGGEGGEKKPRKVVDFTYHDQADATGKKKWAGQGKQIVGWLKTAMDNGVNPDKFLVAGKEHMQRVKDYWAEVSKKKK